MADARLSTAGREGCTCVPCPAPSRGALAAAHSASLRPPCCPCPTKPMPAPAPLPAAMPRRRRSAPASCVVMRRRSGASCWNVTAAWPAATWAAWRRRCRRCPRCAWLAGLFAALLVGRLAPARLPQSQPSQAALLLTAPVQGDWVCPSCAAGKAPPPRRPVTARERFLQRQGLGLARIEAIWQASTPPLLVPPPLAAAALALWAATAGYKLPLDVFVLVALCRKPMGSWSAATAGTTCLRRRTRGARSAQLSRGGGGAPPSTVRPCTAPAPPGPSSCCLLATAAQSTACPPLPPRPSCCCVPFPTSTAPAPAPAPAAPISPAAAAPPGSGGVPVAAARRRHDGRNPARRPRAEPPRLCQRRGLLGAGGGCVCVRVSLRLRLAGEGVRLAGRQAGGDGVRCSCVLRADAVVALGVGFWECSPSQC